MPTPRDCRRPRYRDTWEQVEGGSFPIVNGCGSYSMARDSRDARLLK